jgi:phage terminase large subunit
MIDLKDPLKFAKLLWPDVTFYKQQREIIHSVRDNDETFVPAGNMLGKDFVAAFVALWFFLTRHPVRVVTTSVDHQQLEGVLWGELRRFVSSSKYPLDSQHGGPLIINHLHIRKVVNGKMCGLSYLLGRVAAKGEGMLGHHIAQTGDGIPRTLFIADEASGVEDISYERADTWANRKLVIGNPYPCTNFFYHGVKKGDLLAPPTPMAATHATRADMRTATTPQHAQNRAGPPDTEGE